jgi:hypothetical protein
MDGAAGRTLAARSRARFCSLSNQMRPAHFHPRFSTRFQAHVSRTTLFRALAIPTYAIFLYFFKDVASLSMQLQRHLKKPPENQPKPFFINHLHFSRQALGIIN